METAVTARFLNYPRLDIYRSIGGKSVWCAWVGTESHPRAPPSTRTERAVHARFTRAVTDVPARIRRRTTRVTAPLYRGCALHIHISMLLHAPLRPSCGWTGVHNFSSTLNSSVDRSHRYYILLQPCLSALHYDSTLYSRSEKLSLSNSNRA